MPAVAELETRALPAWAVGHDPHDAEAQVFAAARALGPRLGLSASFGGAGGMVLIDMAARADAGATVFVLDTDFLFPETYALIDRVERKYGIAVERVPAELTPAEQARAHGPELWARDPNLCCEIRKVRPMAALAGRFDAWLTGIQRAQASTRALTPTARWDDAFGLWKLAPLAHWTDEEIAGYCVLNDVPLNPLLFDGYDSLGCVQCTARGSGRAGRWAGLGKTECGLHARPGLASSAAVQVTVEGHAVGR